MWRMNGHSERAPDFPFERRELTPGQVVDLEEWWVRKRVKDWVTQLGDQDFERRQEAQRELVRMGSQVLMVLETLPEPKLAT